VSNKLGRLAALLGILIAVWLFWRNNPREVFGVMRTGGVGLVLAALVHVFPMLASACNWRPLIRDHRRPTISGMLHCVWIRESVNNLLPVARIGGEVVSFHFLRNRGVPGPTAVASIIADMQLGLISQMLFTLIGIAFLCAQAASETVRLAGMLARGVAVLTPLLILFALIQHAKPFERLTQLLNRAMGGRLSALVGHSARIDRRIVLIWRRPMLPLQYLFLWQPLHFLASSLEIWLALYFMHARVGFTKAVIFESLIQAISSAAFFIPGGVGVQEGGFVLIGSALGLDTSICLALAGARRLRDLVIFMPGLLAWQISNPDRPHENDHSESRIQQ
jgi:putative membrane protein